MHDSETTTRFGSDLIVDLLATSGIEFAAFNPGATVRGIHDSLAHETAGQKTPEVVLCLHESISVAIAQGYAKAAGKPMAVLIHNVVGLQNASMAIYNAWCDRTPIMLLGGTGPKSLPQRRPWIDWIHTANVQANLVRDFVKWDDEPHDIASVMESFMRGLTTAVSEPTGPVYLCYDTELQEQPLPSEIDVQSREFYPVPTAPGPDPEAIAKVARILRSAESPVILAGYLGDDASSMEQLGALAEELGAPVHDTGVRFALATDHRLNATGMDTFLKTADVVLALDAEDIETRIGDRWRSAESLDKLRIITVSLGNLRTRAWSQDHQALVPGVEHITSSGDLAVDALLDALRALQSDSGSVRNRNDRAAEVIAAQRAQWRAEGAAAEAPGAVSLSRMIHLVGSALEGRRFVLANGTNNRLEHRQWRMSEPRQYLGWGAGGGLGYGVGATIGSALANRDDIISVDIQADGDLLFLPSALWTASRMALRTLFVVNSNRQYGNTFEHALQIADHRDRDRLQAHVGASIDNPIIDIAGLARSFGVWAAGPISDPDGLEDQLAEALTVLDSGRPALLEVITPGFCA